MGDSRQLAVNELVAGSAVILGVSTGLLILRIYASRLRDASRGWDDYLLPPSWIFLIGLAALNLEGGAGRDLAQVTSRETYVRVRLLYALYWIYPIANTLPRISVVILYTRVFNDKPSRYCSWLVLAFMVAHSAATIIVNNVQCRPLSWVFDHVITVNTNDANCIDLVLWWRDSNFPTIIADVAILLLPVRTIWTLKTSTSKKVGIGLVCLTGSVGLVASCVRTSQLYQIVAYSPEVNFYILFFWTIVECGTYNCAACLIGLRPVLGKMSHYLSSRKSSTPSDTVSNATLGNSRTMHQYFNMATLAQHKENSEDSDDTACEPLPGNDVNIQGSVNGPHPLELEGESQQRPQIHVETHVRVDVEIDKPTSMV